MLLLLSLLNMTEYVWICLNKQDFEYALCPKYNKCLNMTKFWIWQESQCPTVTQCSEYAKMTLDWVLNIFQVLNMPGY